MGIACSTDRKIKTTVNSLQSENSEDPNFEIKQRLNEERVTKLRKTFPSPTQHY